MADWLVVALSLSFLFVRVLRSLRSFIASFAFHTLDPIRCRHHSPEDATQLCVRVSSLVLVVTDPHRISYRQAVANRQQ